MPRTSPDTLTLDFAVKPFLFDGQARNLSQKTLYNYEQQLGWFVSFVGAQGIHRLNDIQPV